MNFEKKNLLFLVLFVKLYFHFIFDFSVKKINTTVNKLA